MITIEFHGVVRLRAGRARLLAAASDVGEALTAARTACPGLEGTVLSGDWVLPAYRVNINARHFPQGPRDPLRPGDLLLLLSLDMGG